MSPRTTDLIDVCVKIKEVFWCVCSWTSLFLLLCCFRRRRMEKVALTFKEKATKLRKTVFPIEVYEMKKFFLMSGMMFFIIYVYTVVRDTKDTLVVSHCDHFLEGTDMRDNIYIYIWPPREYKI